MQMEPVSTSAKNVEKNARIPYLLQAMEIDIMQLYSVAV